MSSSSVSNILFTLGVVLAAGWPAQGMASGDSSAPLRLYAMHCGSLSLESMSMFEDTDEYTATPGDLVVPCYLIRHPEGDLIWDTGLGDQLARHGDGVVIGEGVTARVDVTLEAQLRQLDLVPGDIDYVAFSHFHFDHTNNAPLFAQSTYIVNRKELDWAQGTPTPFGVNLESLNVLADAKTQLIEFDHDVFNDGSVRILQAPGHTPGHQVLMLQLTNAGTVILSGDLYHTHDNHELSRVPAINTSRAETLASIDRISRLMEKQDARLVIQHAPEDFAALPRFPAHLD
ncbi:MAG: N-acyl homoserine lactonase family protein [Ectothiorhodospiraceae bacterium]|nr:N-acyl homoserine lactonase family protein [Ectothiorhodospiraceae bacterium]